MSWDGKWKDWTRHREREPGVCECGFGCIVRIEFHQLAVAQDRIAELEAAIITQSRAVADDWHKFGDGDEWFDWVAPCNLELWAVVPDMDDRILAEDMAANPEDFEVEADDGE